MLLVNLAGILGGLTRPCPRGLWLNVLVGKLIYDKWLYHMKLLRYPTSIIREVSTMPLR